MDLTTAPASGGSQSTTQNPQTVPSGQAIAGATPQSRGVQPGTSRDVLTSQNGLSLSGSSLTTVSLNNTTAGTTVGAGSAASTQKTEHDVNFALLALAAVLVVIAMAFFGVLNRSAKNTTN